LAAGDFFEDDSSSFDVPTDCFQSFDRVLHPSELIVPP
jgi:hypothetical protein